MVYSCVRGGGRARRANRWTKLTITGFALAALVAGATVSTAAAGSANAPGVTNKAVKIGYIFSETGVASSTFRNAGKAFQARIDRANAEGGVNGRKIDAVIINDASSSANLTAAKDLVENQNVFAVVNNSSFAFLSYRYLLEQGVPMIGGGYDGPYYGQKGNENIVSALGNAGPVPGLTWDFAARVAKKMGAKKVAALAYGAAAGSAANAKGFQEYAVPANGMEAAYTNLGVDFGTTDINPLVLGIKNAGADASYLPMIAATDIAIVQGLQQNGVDMKANLLAQGYGQDLLDSPAAATLGPNTLFWQAYKPVELKTPETKKFQADLKRYAGLEGVPDYGQYLGYIIADLTVTGLQQAGKNLTRQSFIDGLHTLDAYDAAGLTCRPIDLSLKTFGKYSPTSCSYFEYVKDGKFVVYNNGKPVTGKLVGDPALLKANAAGGLTAPTTAPATTAAPSS